MLSDLREPGLAGQKQVSVFSHVETTGGVGQVNIPVGESCSTRPVLSAKLHVSVHVVRLSKAINRKIKKVA